MKKKILAFCLSLIMCCSLFVGIVPAAEPLAKVTLVGWDADSYVGRWNAYAGVDGENGYYVCLYKNGIRINDAYLAGLPGKVNGSVTSYDFTDLIKQNGVGTYTFTVGAFVSQTEDYTTTQSIESDSKIYYVPEYNINVNTSNPSMGSVYAKVGGYSLSTASEGASVTLFAEANRGYRFDKWISSDVDAASGSFVMPAKDVNVEAVFKTFPAVSGLKWNADTYEGSWDAYAGATYYDVVLYKNGSMVRNATTHLAEPGNIGNETHFDFKDLIEANGDGVYKFTVAAYIDNLDDLNDSISEMSEGKERDVIPNVSGLSWDTDSFKGSWNAYTGVEKYFVALYKDGKRINNEYDAAVPGYVGTDTSYDFSNLVAENGEGTYTFTVGAFVTETEDLLATEGKSAGKKYTLSKYTITVEKEGGNYFCSASSNPISADKGETVTLTAKAGEGYHFVGWKSSDVDASKGAFIMPEKNVKVIAVFKEGDSDKYTVSFNMNGHGSPVAAQTVAAEGTAKEPEMPTEKGWIFKGWYADSTFSSAFDFATKITKNTTLYAKWYKEMVYNPDSTNPMTWEEGSNEGLTFVFHRAENDSETFGHFMGIMVDGKLVGTDNYDAASGSLILKIKASFLKTLAAGTHKLTVLFDDGSAVVEFKIKAAPAPAPDPDPNGNVPPTGDNTNSMAFIISMIVSVGIFAALGLTRKKKEEM